MSQLPTLISLNLEHSYAEQLPEFVESVSPDKVRDPQLLQLNQSLAEELGLDPERFAAEVAAQIFSGNQLPQDARPVAQAYAGHQFGNFVPQLGDGRALLLGEVVDREGTRRDIALKGSGRTPFSRGGDGKAVVGPVLREYLIAEAMHALGVPTTRALAAVATGESVMRERPLPGAVLARVASSHVRVGTFQFFSVRRQTESVQKLADYVIARHYPSLIEIPQAPERYRALLRSVVERQALLISKWMLIGFIHGVMNTDNMAIAGETIDYGPCAFMDVYDPQTVFSSIDRHGRYAYMNQPSIAVWNLARFAETILPLFGEDDSERAASDATEILHMFMPTFEQFWYQGALNKLGLPAVDGAESIGERERELIDDWIQLLAENKVDYTLAWRRLADAAEGDVGKLQTLFVSPNGLNDWLERWLAMSQGGSSQLASTLRAANPIYIPRNHLVEEALLAAAEEGDLKPFETLLTCVQNPFAELPQHAKFALPASAEFTANYQTFCGT